jgi:hypothetical protein
MTSTEARLMLMAIAGQETNWDARCQSGGGPALSYWQFEPIGCQGVMETEPTLARAVLETSDIPETEAHASLQYHDAAACAFARLLLWSDPAELPLIGDEDGAWDFYLRCWRPGKPDRDRWTPAYDTATTIVCGPMQRPRLTQDEPEQADC